MGTWGAKGSPGWSVSCPCASVSPAGNKHCVLQGRGLRLVLGVTSPGGMCVSPAPGCVGGFPATVIWPKGTREFGGAGGGTRWFGGVSRCGGVGCGIHLDLGMQVWVKPDLGVGVHPSLGVQGGEYTLVWGCNWIWGCSWDIHLDLGVQGGGVDWIWAFRVGVHPGGFWVQGGGITPPDPQRLS